MEPVFIEFLSQGECIQGKFYLVDGIEKPVTLLFVPGWPAYPEDFLGLGPNLSEHGIQVMEFFPRGMQSSEGIYTHRGALHDIGSALQWLRQPAVTSQFNVYSERLVLGGFSNGGGLALAYAAQDPSVRSIISCACNDFGEFTRQIQVDPGMSETIRSFLLATLAPAGPARFDLDGCLQELIDHPDIFGLRENAARLADRTILMFGGWEDEMATIDRYQLPLYRALKAADGQDVTFIVYHTDHNFTNVYERLASDISEWLSSKLKD